MSEDREQKRNREDKDNSQQVTASARRGRRPSARSAARKGDEEGRATASGAAESRSTRTTESKGRPTPSRDGQQGRVSPFRKIGRFLREVVAELRKVIWPTRRLLLVYTAVVLVFVSVMVAFVAGLDVLFAKGVLWLFG